MPLIKLDVYGLRNLKSVQLALNPGINLFHGSNGSGKTSLLEAVFLLGRARSFRTRLHQAVIHGEHDQCTVFGLIQHQGASTPIGVTRYRPGGGVFKLAGQAVTTASALADALPLLLINQESFNLLEGSPQHRRRFIDWGVFHVEHSHQQVIQRFQRVLKQRNSLLRHDRIDDAVLSTWDREFELAANAITAARSSYLLLLLPMIQQVLNELSPPLARVDFSLYPGWDDEKKLATVLQADRRRDQQFRTTHHGPHRADLRIRFDRHNAAEVLSRGQLKILAIAMQLAQGFLFHRKTGRHSIYLIDDLAAELDLAHKKVVARLLHDMGAQALITGVDRESLQGLWTDQDIARMRVFHVEHGQIYEEGPDNRE
ncbi:DNA replication/repair protein RecF [Porticoccus sp.]